MVRKNKGKRNVSDELSSFEAELACRLLSNFFYSLNIVDFLG